MAQWTMGVDLGGTKIEVAQIDPLGKILRREKFPTHVEGGPQGVAKQIEEALFKMREEIGGAAVGVGVGVAGQVEGESMVRFAPNLDWHDVDLGSELRAAVGLPIVILNDVRAAAWGEWLHGAGKGHNDLVCLFVGTGIGGGIVSGGQMLKGCSNTAGEVGHMIIDMNGPECSCGSHGCLEAWAGGKAISRRARAYIESHPEEGGAIVAEAGDKPITTQAIIAAYRKKDLLATHFIGEARKALVIGAAGLINTINPCRLILGGGVTEGLPEIVPWIDSGVREIALKAATSKLEVVHAELGNDAGVVGAAARAMQLFGGQ